jgi:SAM-dependent MidA family methyltransferase
MTALRREIAELIAGEGPISVERYMALALSHPRHGYYRSRDPFGAQGDFVTAPEISQMFGELIGLWAADCWARIGEPARFAFVELGPASCLAFSKRRRFILSRRARSCARGSATPSRKPGRWRPCR